MGKRFLLSSLVLGVGLISPASALAGTHGSNLPLKGRSTGVVSIDISTGPAPAAGSSSGVASLLGAFTATSDELFATTGGVPPNFSYTVWGNETMVAANGDELFGTIPRGDGNGVITPGFNEIGTNVVTITGGTGRFAHATGSYTETYTSQIAPISATAFFGPIATTIRGTVNLGSPPRR